MTLSGVLGDSKCECTDRRCPAHEGIEDCQEVATIILYRIDMEDITGTAMCEDCASDAFESGLFTDDTDDTDDTGEYEQ